MGIPPAMILFPYTPTGVAIVRTFGVYEKVDSCIRLRYMASSAALLVLGRLRLEVAVGGKCSKNAGHSRKVELLKKKYASACSLFYRPGRIDTLRPRAPHTRRFHHHHVTLHAVCDSLDALHYPHTHHDHGLQERARSALANCSKLQRPWVPGWRRTVNLSASA